MDLLGWIRTASKNERDGPFSIATTLCVARPMLSITIFKSHQLNILWMSPSSDNPWWVFCEININQHRATWAGKKTPLSKHQKRRCRGRLPSAAVGATPCSRVFHMVPCAMQAAASEVGLLKKLAVYGTTMIARYHCRLNIRLIYVCNIIYIY